MTDVHARPSRPLPAADDALLDELARHAADLVRPGVHCGITLREFRSLRTAGSSDLRVRRCDAVQQAERSGPGLAALDEHRVVVVAHTGRTRRWPAWRDAAVREGFRSAVAVPAPVGPGVDVAVELYDDTAAQWQREELRRATTFTVEVARVVALELEVARLRCLSEELFAGVSARDVMGQATGIVMAQRHCGPEEAMGVLRRAAEHRGIHLRDLATMIVAETTRSDQMRSVLYDEATVPRPAVVLPTHRLP
jgi:ANTAR domain